MSFPGCPSQDVLPQSSPNLSLFSKTAVMLDNGCYNSTPLGSGLIHFEMRLSRFKNVTLQRSISGYNVSLACLSVFCAYTYPLFTKSRGILWTFTDSCLSFSTYWKYDTCIIRQAGRLGWEQMSWYHQPMSTHDHSQS
jgi:hypothetical protein